MVQMRSAWKPSDVQMRWQQYDCNGFIWFLCGVPHPERWPVDLLQPIAVESWTYMNIYEYHFLKVIHQFQQLHHHTITSRSLLVVQLLAAGASSTAVNAMVISDISAATVNFLAPTQLQAVLPVAMPRPNVTATVSDNGTAEDGWPPCLKIGWSGFTYILVLYHFGTISGSSLVGSVVVWLSLYGDR